MLLTIATTRPPATDLSWLLHKRPDRCQSFDLSFGQAHVFYPEATVERTTVALLLEPDPVALVRGKSREQSFLLSQYVNDRPFVASSFLSVAISQVFGSALSGRCKDRPELVETPFPLEARIDVLTVRGGHDALARVFEPLGYAVESRRHPLDERFPEWGEGPYHTVTISGTKRLAELLTHLYVLVPVFDDRKHYFVGEDELEKLLAKGEGWLAEHPEKQWIARGYLKHRPGLYRDALARLIEEERTDPPEESTADVDESAAATEVAKTDEKDLPLRLNETRHLAVLEALRVSGATSVVDLGCGEGKFLRRLAADRRFERIVGLDVSIRALEIAKRRLRLERAPEAIAKRIELLHGSLIYRDRRIAGFDAAALVEVIEHLDPQRLTALERVVFEFARPRVVVVTTPNAEYNVGWETLPAGEMRHDDHRFEWSRPEFQAWSGAVATRHGYAVAFQPIGPEHPDHGSPTQMAVFTRNEGADG